MRRYRKAIAAGIIAFLAAAIPLIPEDAPEWVIAMMPFVAYAVGHATVYKVPNAKPPAHSHDEGLGRYPHSHT